jgi:NTP pyrophosphatase (non-canonical NTP hydrolase)
MDGKTTITELKEEIRKFNAERDWDQFHSAKDLAIAISLEAVEVLEPFVYKSDAQSKDIMSGTKRQDIEDELADVLWAVLMFAERYDIDISDALRAKMKKSALKYPADKVRGSNKKYNEY